MGEGLRDASAEIPPECAIAGSDFFSLPKLLISGVSFFRPSLFSDSNLLGSEFS